MSGGLRVGDHVPDAIYLGDAGPAERVYLGDTLVWGDPPPEPHLAMRFRTTGSATDVAIPLWGTVDVTIDWGDGSPPEHVTSDNPSHDYGQAGVWQVRVDGTATALGISSGTPTAQWRQRLEAMSAFGDTGITNLANAWRNCLSLTSLDISGWDVSAVTTMNSTWYGCSSLTELDISGWDVSAVTSLSYAWYNCLSLTSLDISGWDVSAVTSLADAWNGCSSLTELDISGWDVSAVTSLAYVWRNCSSLTELDISGWDVSAVTSLADAWNGCSSLTELDISGWDVSAVTSLAFSMSGVTLDTASYDAILTGWGSQNVRSNVSFHAGNSRYSPAGQAGRDALLAAGWTITDGGPA